MKKLTQSLTVFTLIGLAGTANADQAHVNIIYPIDGASYPVMQPAPAETGTTYFTSSFSVTCVGGEHTVKWGFDGGGDVGISKFYDQTSIQFVHKLPAGKHVFMVKSDCGQSFVKFKIGN